MLKRIGSIAGLAIAVSLAVVATAVARPQAVATAAAGNQCKTVTVGMLAPITGALSLCACRIEVEDPPSSDSDAQFRSAEPPDEPWNEIRRASG